MTAEEMWRLSGLQGDWEAWAFGDAPDKLASLVLAGQKTGTSSAQARSMKSLIFWSEAIPSM